jgi:hypothetical protein
MLGHEGCRRHEVRKLPASTTKESERRFRLEHKSATALPPAGSNTRGKDKCAFLVVRNRSSHVLSSWPLKMDKRVKVGGMRYRARLVSSTTMIS